MDQINTFKHLLVCYFCLKLLAIAIILLLSVSVLLVQESYAQDSKKKLRFSGTHNMKLYGEPQIDFRIDPLVETPYTVNGTINVGGYKTEVFGGGFLKPEYHFLYDRTCKSITGFEYLFSLNGDFVRMNYFGKVCYMGSNIKSVNLVFNGDMAKGIFENANIGGTFSGNSDKYERQYNLLINSILVYEN